MNLFARDESNLTKPIDKQIIADASDITTIEPFYYRSLPSSELEKITQLFINHAKLEVVPLDVLSLVNLKKLTLVDNNLLTIPDLSCLVNLETLILDENNLLVIPETVVNIYSLKILGLAQNILSEIPDSIANLTNLTELNLCNNDLESLPNSLSRLIRLKHLVLNCNNFSEAPEVIQHLTKLKQLDLSQNSLITLPKCYESLAKLKCLNISYNRIHEFPYYTKLVKGLTYFNYRETFIRYIPICFAYANKITVIEGSLFPYTVFSWKGKKFELLTKLQEIQCTIVSKEYYNRGSYFNILPKDVINVLIKFLKA